LISFFRFSFPLPTRTAIGRSETLPQECEQFFRRVESQLFSRINFFYPAFEQTSGWLRFFS
jgi:hypothetical protein